MENDFEDFGKIARLSRECVITEKIDGTNAQIYITRKNIYSELTENDCTTVDEYIIRAGSRSRWITPEDDNFGFAKWVRQNNEELLLLGEGRHYGEWWGSGIQRGYGLTKGEKRFSLFNTHRWLDDAVRPKCCGVVPVLYKGAFDTSMIDAYLEVLRLHGSLASPGFMKPEGIVIYHTHANMMFKKTIEKDDEHKSQSSPV